MKILILKHYSHVTQYFYNYGDDMDEVFHSSKFMEEVMEVDAERLKEIRSAVTHFNQKQMVSGGSKVSLAVVEVIDVSQVTSLVSDMMEDYKKAEAEKIEQEKARRARSAKAAESKREKALKKLSKESGVSLEQIKALSHKK